MVAREEQAKAETVARQIHGVQGVSNLLQVVAAPDEQAGQTAFATPAFKDITVKVQSGVVRLTGLEPVSAQIALYGGAHAGSGQPS